MDITRLLSGISGMTEAKEVRLVELKIGQVVRGVLLKMLSEQEGMVSIAGVPVRARLETPLLPGQATWLQVQPESNGTEVVLKPLTGSGTPIAERSLAELLKWLGLDNTEQNRQLVQLMHQNGLSVDRETVKTILQSMTQKPEGADIRQWLTAAAAAQGKGIPMTGETVRALHAVLFGKPAGETMRTLQQALDGWLQRDPAQAGSNPNAVQAAERLVALLGQAMRATEARLANPSAMSGDGPLSSGRETGNATNAGASAPADVRPNGTPAPGSQAAATGGALAREAGSGHPPAAPAQPDAGQGARPAAIDGTVRTGGTPPAEMAAIREPDAWASRSAAADRSGEMIRAGRMEAQSAAVSRTDPLAVRDAAPSAAQPASPHSGRLSAMQAGQESALRGEPSAARQEPWLANLFRDLGFEHEHRLLDRAALSPAEQGLPDGMRETVKGLVLSLLNEPNLPPTVKEALQLALHHITGQQLLLAADPRTPFSVVTLSVPLPGQHGNGEAATVEIHARRNKGEPLDAANCRLLFDLQLARLGNLLMDVQVVERMVSVRMLSDHPAMETLVSDGRPEAEEALAGIGYRLLSLMQAPYPKAPAEEGPASPPEAAAGAGTASASMLLGRKPYKGVDLRI